MENDSESVPLSRDFAIFRRNMKHRAFEKWEEACELVACVSQ